MPRSHRATGKPRGNPNWRKKKTEPTPAPVVEEVDASTAPGEEEEEAEGLVFDVEDAPEEEPEPELSPMARIRAAAASALGKVGIISTSTASGGGGKPSDAAGGRLNKRQREFADTITPAIVGVFVFGSQWAWKRKGIEYVVLAPDDDTATKIIAPLVRILARHSKNGGLSPDTLDMLASFGAVMAYGRYVHKHYANVQNGQYIQEEEESNEPGTADDYYNRYSTGTDDTSGYESGDVSSHYRRAYRTKPTSAALSDANGNGDARAFSPNNLTERERKQYQALRGLADRDLQSRMRRSGNVRPLFRKAG